MSAVRLFPTKASGGWDPWVKGQGTERLAELAGLIRQELDSREGQPTERAVSGRLVKLFDAEWPAGWYWEDHSLWGEGPNDEFPDEPEPPDDDLFYDFRDWTLNHEDGREESLWFLFKKWHKAHLGK